MNVVNYVRGIPMEDFGTDRRGPVRRKLVLLMLATYADSDGGNAWPSQARLAREAGCTERALRDVLGWLQEHKFLTVHYKAHQIGKSTWKMNEYTIHTRTSVLPGTLPATPGSSEGDTRKQLAQGQPEACTSYRPPENLQKQTTSSTASLSQKMEEKLNVIWDYYLDATGRDETLTPPRKKMGLAIANQIRETSDDSPVVAMTNVIDLARHLAKKNPKKESLFQWHAMFSKWETFKSLETQYNETPNVPEAARLPDEYYTAPPPPREKTPEEIAQEARDKCFTASIHAKSRLFPNLGNFTTELKIEEAMRNHIGNDPARIPELEQMTKDEAEALFENLITGRSQ